MVRRAAQGYHKRRQAGEHRVYAAASANQEQSSPDCCFRAGRCHMADALNPGDGGSGEATAGDDRGLPRPARERAAHYRDYAAQIRALAEGEQNGALRDRLIKIAGEYEGLAKDSNPGPVARRARPKQVSRPRRARSPGRARPAS